MKKTETMKKKRKTALLAATLAAMLLCCSAISGNAAQAAKIEIEKTSARVDLNSITNIEVEYQMPASTAAQLAVVVADETIAAAAVSDSGKGKAVLAVSGLQPGTTVVAVYEASNPAIVDYVTIKSGMAKEGKVYTLNEGSAFTTVYDDILISYNSLMNAQNLDQLAVSHLEIERNSGIDGLIVEGKLWEQNRTASGLLTFYANFYDAAGKLIDRQPYYLKNTGAGSSAKLIWYIPEGCTKIVVE